jgi:hypothetical protein
MKQIAPLLSRRIGDCIGAVAAGTLALVISVRSPEEQAFVYLAVPLLVGGLVACAIAFTHKR